MTSNANSSPGLAVTTWQVVNQTQGPRRFRPTNLAGTPSRRDGAPSRFVGFNRRGPWVWFTTCQVVTAQPGEEFAFDVTTFGMPVARWSYRLAAVPEGTQVTESWRDQRGRGAHLLGRAFTGKVAKNRAQANRDGMRTTLARLKRELEAG